MSRTGESSYNSEDYTISLADELLERIRSYSGYKGVLITLQSCHFDNTTRPELELGFSMCRVADTELEFGTPRLSAEIRKEFRYHVGRMSELLSPRAKEALLSRTGSCVLTFVEIADQTFTEGAFDFFDVEGFDWAEEDAAQDEVQVTRVPGEIYFDISACFPTQVSMVVFQEVGETDVELEQHDIGPRTLMHMNGGEPFEAVTVTALSGQLPCPACRRQGCQSVLHHALPPIEQIPRAADDDSE